jgi:hypothetical protein
VAAGAQTLFSVVNFTIVADSLATRGVPAGTPGRICLSVAGDDPRAKELVLGLIAALGFDGIEAGTLADSWRRHPGTPAYCRDLDADKLKAALAQADAGQIADYRAQADEVARPYFARSQSFRENSLLTCRNC